jgi:hypothetical protein
MTEKPLTSLATFDTICGGEVKQKILIATTMWNMVDLDTGVRREQEIKEVTGTRTIRFRDTNESAWEVVEELMHNLDVG